MKRFEPWYKCSGPNIAVLLEVKRISCMCSTTLPAFRLILKLTAYSSKLGHHTSCHLMIVTRSSCLPVENEEAKSDEYSSEMQNKMGGFLTYRHEDGINFSPVLDDLTVGSCLQTPSDLDR